MRIKKGSGLIDYVVPTLLIGVVVGAGVFALVNNNLLLNFITNSGNAKYNKGKLSISSQGAPDASTKTMILAPRPKPPVTASVSAGQLKGTQENPVSECYGNTCSIDYGSFVINGLPEDFEGYVGSSGTSGGTEKLTALIDEIIQQASKSGSDMDLALLRKLSNQGHELSKEQTLGEEWANSIIKNQAGAIHNELCYLQGTAGDASEMNQSIEATLAQINQKYSNPANQSQANLLNTVNVLGQQILEKNANYISSAMTISSLRNDTSVVSKADDIFSSITVKDSDAIKSYTDALLHPQYSQNTNVRSTIICATGKYSDDGKTCK